MKKFTFVAGIALSISTSAFAANFDFVNVNKNCKAFLPIIQGATIEFTGLCAKGLAEKKGLLTAKISGKKFFSVNATFKDGIPKAFENFQFENGISVAVDLRDDGSWISGEKIVKDQYKFTGGLNLFTEHGFGRIEYFNGHEYAGNFSNGIKNGKGIFKSASLRYEGDFVDNQMQGFGIFEGDYLGSKVTYTGSFTNSKFGPKGKLKFSNQTSYEGDFLNGIPYGKGTIDWISQKYDGEIKAVIKNSDGKSTLEEVQAHGSGRLIANNNAINLVGTFKDNKLFGYAKGPVNGAYLDALFVNGEPTFGTIELLGRAKFHGEIKNWQPGGLGEFTLADSDQRTGGMRTIGNFIAFYKCVGQCFNYAKSGIVFSVQNDSNGRPIPGTQIRLDEGADAFYGVQRQQQNAISTAAQIFRDQQNAFQNMPSSPQMLNNNASALIIDLRGNVLGSGTIWDTRQPGMINGGVYITPNR